MRNRYAQVARTYFRRATGSWVGISFLIGGLVPAAIAMQRPASAGARADLLEQMYLPLALLGLPMWAHFSEQMLQWRKRLTPGYLAPHVVVFATFALLLTIGFPAVVILHQGLSSVGLLAITCAFFATLGVSFVVGTWWVLCVPFALLYLPMAWPPAEQWYSSLIAGGDPMLAIELLGGSIAEVAIMVWLLCTLGQDNRRGVLAFGFDGVTTRVQMTGQASDAWRAQGILSSWQWPRPRTWRRPDRATGAGLWARARRWAPQGNTPALILPFCLVPSLPFFFSATPGETGRDALLPAIIMLSGFAPLMILSAWLVQWKFLETGLLRPISREDFIKEIGMAIARQLITAVVIGAACIAIMAGLFMRHAFPPFLLAALIVAMIGMEVFTSAVLIAVMRRRSRGEMALVGLLILLLGSVLFLPVCVDQLANYAWLSLLAGMALLPLAVIITRQAYRKWLMSDLG